MSKQIAGLHAERDQMPLKCSGAEFHVPAALGLLEVHGEGSDGRGRLFIWCGMWSIKLMAIPGFTGMGD